MKRGLWFLICVLVLMTFAGCGVKVNDNTTGKPGAVDDKDDEDTDVKKSEKIVGEDISEIQVSEFYYTVEDINYNAYYLRYYIYEDDAKHFFYYETRERKDDYGPTTTDDITSSGTIVLTDDQWATIYDDYLKGGKVVKRSESSDSGDTGPWLYLYWDGDEGVYQEFSFETYDDRIGFEKFCESLASESE